MQTDVEPESRSESLDELVDRLLRDEDYLLAQELKQRVEELNMLLERARAQGLKLSLETATQGDPARTVLELKIFREI